MAENLLGVVQAVLLAVYQEAKQASENKEALEGLATRARDIIQPQLEACQTKLSAVNEQHVIPAISHLHSTLKGVLELIIDRGKKKPAYLLPYDAIRGAASKVKHEIEGAEESLFQALQMLMMALHIQNLQVGAPSPSASRQTRCHITQLAFVVVSCE